MRLRPPVERKESGRGKDLGSTVSKRLRSGGPGRTEREEGRGEVSCPDQKAAGFTLLEVVAAIAILVLFLTPLLGAIIHGLRTVDSIERRGVALRLAENKLAELEMLPLPDAEEVKRGDFGEEYPGYWYELEIVKTPELQLLETALPNLRGWEIHLRVLWKEAAGEKMIQVNTLLLE